MLFLKILIFMKLMDIYVATPLSEAEQFWHNSKVQR